MNWQVIKFVNLNSFLLWLVYICLDEKEILPNFSIFRLFSIVCDSVAIGALHSSPWKSICWKTMSSQLFKKRYRNHTRSPQFRALFCLWIYLQYCCKYHFFFIRIQETSSCHFLFFFPFKGNYTVLQRESFCATSSSFFYCLNNFSISIIGMDILFLTIK